VPVVAAAAAPVITLPIRESDVHSVSSFPDVPADGSNLNFLVNNKTGRTGLVI
jgi:hypothetical protein